MSRILILVPPRPADELAFENVFFGDVNTLIALSKARRAVASAFDRIGGELAPAADQAALDAIERYAQLWFDFWRRAIVQRGSSARSREPLSFAWSTVGLRPTADPSPVFECAAVAHALAAMHQRVGASMPTTDEYEVHLAKATATLTMLINDVLQPLVYVSAGTGVRRRRAPVLLSEAYAAALIDAIDAHRQCKAAVVALARPRTCANAVEIALDFFRGARRFERIGALLPVDGRWSRARRQASALAYRYLAEALVALVDSDERAPGVAVALAREARAIDAANERVAEFAASLERRNREEFGLQTVPSSDSISIEFSTDVDAYRVNIEYTEMCVVRVYGSVPAAQAE